EGDTLNKDDIKEIFSGEQKIDAPKKAVLTEDSELLKELGSLKKEEADRFQILKKKTTINEINAQEPNDIGQEIDALNTSTINLESDSFQLYEPIRRDGEAAKTEVLGKVNSAQGVGLSRASGLYELHESLERKGHVKSEELGSGKYAKINDETEEDKPTERKNLPRKDVVTVENILLKTDEFIKKDEKENAKGGTLPEVKSADQIHIVENDEYLKKSDYMKTDEAVFEWEELQKIRSAAKEDAMKTTKPSEKRHYLKGAKAISKGKLSPRNRCLSSVGIRNRKESWKKGDSLSAIDRINEEEFPEKDDSFSSRNIITKNTGCNKVNTTRPTDVISKRKPMEKDDSLSSIHSYTKKRGLEKGDSSSKVDATIEEGTWRKYDSSGAEYYRSSDYSTHRGDVRSRRKSETEDFCSTRDDAYRKYDASQKDSSVKEDHIETEGKFQSKLKSVRKIPLSFQKYGEENADFLDDIRESTKTKKEDNSKKYIYITNEKNMHRKLKVAKDTYTMREKSEQQVHDYTYDTTEDRCCEKDLSRAEIYRTRDNEMHRIMQSVKRTNMSKRRKSEAETDSMDDVRSRSTLSREEYPLRDLHIGSRS
ncbi:hypothetical protein C922_05861, partial [Plasmodium inui San Antonio 1]